MIMKKLFSLCIALALAFSLVGCSSPTLPSGTASRVDFVDGWKISRSTFEYLNENTVKFVREDDGQVFLVPITSIDMIWVAD